MIWQFVRNLFGLTFFQISLKSFLDLFESRLIVKKTLNFSREFLRKNSFVIFSAHDLHVDSVVKISEQAMGCFDLLFGRVLWVFWSLFLSLFDFIVSWLDVLELRFLDSGVGDLDLSKHASLLGELSDRSLQFLDLIWIWWLGIIGNGCGSNRTDWSSFILCMSGFGKRHGECGVGVSLQKVLKLVYKSNQILAYKSSQ